MHRDFTLAQEDFVPLSLRDVNLQKSTVSWADVGGRFPEVRMEAHPSRLIRYNRAERNEESPQGDTGMANKIRSHLRPIALTSPLWVS